jgi:hypothetical protein
LPRSCKNLFVQGTNLPADYVDSELADKRGGAPGAAHQPLLRI